MAEPEDFRGASAAADCTAAVHHQAARLARAIEFEIIPRLLIAHRVGDDRAHPVAADGTDGADGAVGESDVDRLVRLILLVDEAPALQWVDAVMARPVAIDAIYLNLLAPTARRLGELWVEDLADFTEVTIGLGRLQQILRALSASRPALEDGDVAARILLLPAPGEQHTFGLIMVGEFFRAAGWQVVGGSWSDGLDAPAIVAEQWYDAAGFSLAAEIHVDALEQVIASVRRASVNPALVVMVGGPIFSEHPDWVARVGADATASDGRQAPVIAADWLARVQAAPQPGAARSAVRPYKPPDLD